MVTEDVERRGASIPHEMLRFLRSARTPITPILFSPIRSNTRCIHNGNVLGAAKAPDYNRRAGQMDPSWDFIAGMIPRESQKIVRSPEELWKERSDTLEANGKLICPDPASAGMSQFLYAFDPLINEISRENCRSQGWWNNSFLGFIIVYFS